MVLPWGHMKTLGYFLILIGALPYALFFLSIFSRGIDSLKIFNPATFVEMIQLFFVSALYLVDSDGLLLVLFFFILPPIFILVGLVTLRVEKVVESQDKASVESPKVLQGTGADEDISILKNPGFIVLVVVVIIVLFANLGKFF